MVVNLVVFPALCLGVGFWSASRSPAWGIVYGLLASIGLFIVNGIIAVAGCSVIIH